MAYEALYRRYRPGRFDDMIGQTHVFATLKNSLTDDRVGHAYLFSGPRGTGKTSTARILAKALNCTNLQAGEPCDECDSCLAFASNSSYDLYELDAASNNGVDAMRDLIQKVALGSPGRKKVYILDEAHMLSAGAENALLKTLEEPPDHVIFVLCTTEPNKVIPTIRSRTQHLEFRLYPAEELADLAREVAADAGLNVDDAGIEFAVKAARGSARDMLSALDQVAAAGGVPDDDDQLSAVMRALAEQDTGAALVAVNEATRLGRDPEVIGRGLLAELRNAFLASMQADLSHMSEADVEAARHRAEQFGPAAITRAVEAIGRAVVDMRQAPDPRVDLEVALVRLTRPELDTDPAALVARIEQLEAGGGTRPSASPPNAPAPAPAPATVVAPPSDSTANAPADAEPRVSASRAELAVASVTAEPAPAPSGGGGDRPADVARRMLPPRPGQRAAPPAAAPEPEASAEPAGDAPATSSTSKPTLGARRRAAANQSVTPAAPVAPPPVADVDRSSAPTDNVKPPASEPPAAPPTAQVPPSEPPPGPVDQAPAPKPPPAAPVGGAPTLDAVNAAWSESILPTLPNNAKARFSAGHFSSGPDGGLQFALPNDVHRQRCEDVRDGFDTALTGHFGQPVPVTLVVEDAPAFSETGANAPSSAAQLEDEESVDLTGLVDAKDAGGSDILERIEEAFPGSEILQPPPET